MRAGKKINRYIANMEILGRKCIAIVDEDDEIEVVFMDEDSLDQYAEYLKAAGVRVWDGRFPGGRSEI